MKTIITFDKIPLYRLFLVCFLMMLYASHALAGTARNWKGATSSDWNDGTNWSPAGVPAAGDILSIGVVSFTNQPIISSTPTSPASITLGLKKAITLTVNSGFTLNVNGPVTQKPSSAGFGTLTNTLAGAGAINCTSLNVGDNTTFLLTFGNNLITLASTIASLHVSGNLSINSTNNGILFIGTCYNNATFSLQGGTTTIDGTIFTANTAGGILSFTTASPIFSVDMPTGSALTPVLQLTNTSAINTASVAGSIDFYNNTGGTGTCTVNYSGTDQTVYTNNIACLDNTPQTYQNLILSGAGTKTVGTATGTTLSVGNDLTTSATTTDLSAYNPTVTIGDNWVNSGNVTGGSGNITVTNLLQNNSNTITLAGGATTIGISGIQLNGGGIVAGAGTLTDNGVFQNNGGALTCGSGSVIFNGNYQNNAGTFTAGTGTVFFSGGTQSLYDNTTAGTKFRKVTFNGTGTATITAGTGNFSVAGNGTLTMVSPAKLIAGSTAVGGTGYLTLLSTSSSTATVAAISGSSTITGAVNVERLVSGGSSSFRGYRLLSSPVNVNNLTAISYPSNIGYLGLTYLNINTATTNGILTAGPLGTTNGFSVTNTNPLIYLYDESMTTSNNSFVSGKNVGIIAITGASGSPAYSVTTLSVSTTTPGITIPVGNSILLYYVGSTSSSVLTSGRVPDNADPAAVGYLNQGNIPVVFWKTSSTSVPYHNNGGNLPGLNQVGNPYASTISLDQLYTDNSTISPIFWELNDQTGGAYISYNASSGATSNSRASKNIVSGQGFIMQATGTGQTITFKEDQKISYPAGFTSSSSPGALLLSMPPTASLTDPDSRVFASIDTPAIQPGKPALAGLHLQLNADTTTISQTGIYFSNNWSDCYNPNEDAVDISPITRVHLSSFSADGSQLEINELGDYTSGKRIKLYTHAITTGIYALSLADITNIDTAANNIYLVDKKMNDSLDMVRYKSYAFNIIVADTTTYGANRFVLAIDPKSSSQDSLSRVGSHKKSAITHNLVVYPNPATSIINISLSENAPASYTEDIYNTSGSLVKHASEASATFTEDISNYKLGVYIIELKDTNGNLLGKSKFVKVN